MNQPIQGTQWQLSFNLRQKIENFGLFSIESIPISIFLKAMQALQKGLQSAIQKLVTFMNRPIQGNESQSQVAFYGQKSEIWTHFQNLILSHFLHIAICLTLSRNTNDLQLSKTNAFLSFTPAHVIRTCRRSLCAIVRLTNELLNSGWIYSS